jgi:predicted nucleic acid-binding protein
MTFDDVPAGIAIFLDANTLVYHFTNDPQFGAPCTRLLERIRRREIGGLTSTHVLADMAYRVLTIEACIAYGYSYTGINRRLKRHPADVQRLTRFRQAVDDVPAYGVQILPVTPGLIPDACAISQQTGLLTNDALVVAIMRQHGLDALASHDADFDRVPGLTRYAPV